MAESKSQLLGTGKKITNITEFLDRIHSGKPIVFRKSVYQAKEAGKFPIGDCVQYIKEGLIFEYRDLEYFESGVTVEELIDILKKFDGKLKIEISGLYGAVADEIAGFKEDEGKLLIMTDICTG